MSETPPYGEFFARIDSSKQVTFARRVCHELIKGWGLQSAMGQFFQGEAATSNVGEMTPEWLSDYAGCPIMFRSVKDYQLEQVFDTGKEIGVPDPRWLLDHRIDGPKTHKVWAKLWRDTKEQFGQYHYVATCFRVKWGAHTLVLHNYAQTLLHTPSSEYPVRGGSLVWVTGQDTVILQYLRDLLSVLRKDWQYGLD